MGPASVQEMADCMPLAFDLADLYRMPVMVLADGILGQMMEPISLTPKPRRELPPKDWALTGADGRPQNIVRSLWLGEGVLEEFNNKLQARYREIEQKEVICEEYRLDDAEIVLVAYGVAARIARAAVGQAREEGIPVGLIRPVTLWPFPTAQIDRAAERFPIFLTVELSAGQMVEDVKLAVAGKAPVLLHGRPGGGVPGTDELVDRIRQLTLPSARA
jgi:2-oxoglutarate ferredoxin oxidoreductase subunit alpha